MYLPKNGRGEHNTEWLSMSLLLLACVKHAKYVAITPTSPQFWSVDPIKPRIHASDFIETIAVTGIIQKAQNLI